MSDILKSIKNKNLLIVGPLIQLLTLFPSSFFYSLLTFPFKFIFSICIYLNLVFKTQAKLQSLLVYNTVSEQIYLAK